MPTPGAESAVVPPGSTAFRVDNYSAAGGGWHPDLAIVAVAVELAVALTPAAVNDLSLVTLGTGDPYQWVSPPSAEAVSVRPDSVVCPRF